MIWVGRNFKAHHHGQGHLPIAQIAPSPTRQSGARAAPAGTPEPRSGWAGRVLGGKSTESRSGKCEQAPVRPVGGNSSSGGWVHPGGRPGSNFSSAEEGFSLAGSGEMCRENNLFLKILFKSRRSPPSHARRGAAIWLCATALVTSAARSPRPPQPCPCPCPLPPAGHRPPLPAGLGGCQRSHGVRWVGDFAVVPTAGRAKAVLQAGEGIFNFFFFSTQQKGWGGSEPTAAGRAGSSPAVPRDFRQVNPTGQGNSSNLPWSN